MTMPPNGIPLIVLGMHRSGTSMLMRLCNLVGVYLGDRLFAAREDNPKGFWEHADIIDIDERIFRLYGLTSQDVLPLPGDWKAHPEFAAMKEGLLTALRRDLAGPRLWGLKDPRIGRLTPLWLEIFAELGVAPRFVIPFRHPAEVAASQVKRDHISFERGALLWLLYNLDIEYYTRGLPRTFVSFDRLYREPARVLSDISGKLGLEFPLQPGTVQAQISEFVEPELRHQRSTAEDDARLPELALDLHRILAVLERAGGDASALDKRRADLHAVLATCAETLYAMKPPTGVWRQTVEAKQHEIEMLKTKLREFEGQR